MIGKIQGQRLILAKMHIAGYLIALESQSGLIDIPHALSNLNREFKLVEPEQEDNFIQDITNFYNALKNQQILNIDRGGYWKFRANTALDALNVLRHELALLQN